MNLIDADKFLSYLIFSKHIDSLTCGEVKEAVEMCKVDVLDKIRAEVADTFAKHGLGNTEICFDILNIIDKKGEPG